MHAPRQESVVIMQHKEVIYFRTTFGNNRTSGAGRLRETWNGERCSNRGQRISGDGVGRIADRSRPLK
jgi:hypothetical protein